MCGVKWGDLPPNLPHNETSFFEFELSRAQVYYEVMGLGEKTISFLSVKSEGYVVDGACFARTINHKINFRIGS
jgi:hypothetical protein